MRLSGVAIGACEGVGEWKARCGWVWLGSGQGYVEEWVWPCGWVMMEGEVEEVGIW